MEKWEYLITEEYQLRQYICKYFLKEVDYIVDVGAYKKTFEGNNVIAIDPLCSIDGSYHGSLNEWYKNTNVEISKCGFVFLGLDIEGGEEEINCFLKVVKESKILVLEFAKKHQSSLMQFNMAISQSNKKIIMDIDFKFPNVVTNGYQPFSERRMCVLKNVE